MNILDTYRPGSKRFAADLSGIYSDRHDLIFLLRHGRFPGHDFRRFIGTTDLPLDQPGRTQALWWARQFRDIRFREVHASRLIRSLETASLACPSNPIIRDSRLNEIHLGEWEGRSFEEIRQQHPRDFERRGRSMDRFRPRNGESFDDVFDRVFPFFMDLGHRQPGITLVVTHAGVIRVLISHLLKIYPKGLFKIRPEYGQLFLLSWQGP